jgi:hypothetical protein
MSTEEERSRPAGGGGGDPAAAGGGQGARSEEELRRSLEEELRKLRVQDVLLQSVVSLINLTSRRIAKEDERDLEQARTGIEAVRALVELLDPEPAEQVRNALSELQVAYAKQAEEPPAGEPEATAPQGPEPSQPPQPEQKPPSKLWTPPGT